jgi:acyl carrier protein
MAETNILSFDEFRRFLSDTLGVAEAALIPDANLLIDLAIDSIKMVEMVLQIERQLGITVPVPSDAVWEILTVGDAYDYYVNLLRGGSASTLTQP